MAALHRLLVPPTSLGSVLRLRAVAPSTSPIKSTWTVISGQALFPTSNFSTRQTFRLRASISTTCHTRSSSAAAAPSIRRKNSANGDRIISMPPNLTFDKRSTVSPFYGLDRVGGLDVDLDRADTVEEEDYDLSDTGDVENKEKEIQSASDDKDTNENREKNHVSDDEESQEEEDEKAGEGEVDDEFVEKLYDASTITEPQYAIPLPNRLHVPIINLSTTEEVGHIYLSEHVFGIDPIRPDLLQRVVKYQRNKKRGKRKAKTKTISEVSGSGRKVRNQKGGGVARAGHRRPAHWRGGAKAHGPKGSIQDYTTKLNKKVRKLGLKHALSQKLKEGNLVLMSDLLLETHKTKTLAAILDRYDIGGDYGATAFVVDHTTEGGVHEQGQQMNGEEVVVTPTANIGGINVNLRVASRNLHKIKVVNQLGCNVYDILKHERLVLSLSALEILEKRLM